ncbi:hypothetical protein [Streptomyces sp. NPDC059828]|uniref:hypothetical protein n=1 Tax=Streptomyces sp. NPDC059828 TaxID=3346965 RepID=UPI00365BA425
MTAVLSTGWDSVRQRARLSAQAPGGGAPAERLTALGRAELLGRLRWEVIQGGSLFLSYPQLLDGAVSRRSGPPRSSTSWRFGRSAVVRCCRSG